MKDNSKDCANCGCCEYMYRNSSFDWSCENCGWEEQQKKGDEKYEN